MRPQGQPSGWKYKRKWEHRITEIREALKNVEPSVIYNLSEARFAGRIKAVNGSLQLSSA